MGRPVAILLAALLAVPLILVASPAEATHFRFKDLSWRQVSGTEVELRMTSADRRSFYFPQPSVGDSW